MKEQILIDNTQYKLVVKYNEVDLDYYTDVFVEVILNNERFTLFKDNLLELRNIIKSGINNIKELNYNLEESSLGILLNEYYLSLYDAQELSYLIEDDTGEWIGVKYCISIGSESAVWLYKYKGKIIFRVTPLFNHFEEPQYVDEFIKFKESYKDILKKNISVDDLKKAKEIILQLYSEFIDSCEK